MASFDGSPSPVQLILVVENKTPSQEKEDFTPFNVTLRGKLASRWKKIRQKEGVNDVDLVQLLLDRFENTSHLFEPVPAISESNTFITSKGPIRITSEALPKGSGSKDSDGGREEESAEDNQRSGQSSKSIDLQMQEDIDGTSQEGRTAEEANLGQQEEDTDDEDGGVNAEDNFDSDPAGFSDESDTDEYKPDSDSDWEQESEEDISEEEDWEDEEDEDGRKRKKKKISQEDEDLPFKRYDMKEVAKIEGALGDETEDREDSRQRARIKRLYWTEMMRSYHCKVCSYQYSSARQVSLHLLQEHSEMVGDLVTFLKDKPASDSEAGITMYDLVLETFPLTSEVCRSVGMEAGYGVPIEEPESVSKEDEKMEPAGDKNGSGDKSEEKEEDIFDGKEFVTMLMRWVEIHVTCQHCQQEVCRTGIFTPKGNKIVHQCRTDKPESVLCDVCGKSFSYKIFRSHWKEVHGESEQGVCPYCGKMFKSSSMGQHIKTVHTSSMKNKYPCGICGKGFKNASARKVHEAIHKRDKPHVCTYCGRRFTQASNMKYHMRQHTGEKPYRCDTCHVSFTHNVSLKNHLKKQHGIDLWEMGYTGGGRPKKQKVQVVASE